MSGGSAVKPVAEALEIRFRGCAKVKVITKQPHVSCCTAYRWDSWGGDEIRQLHSVSTTMLAVSDQVATFVRTVVNPYRARKMKRPLPPLDLFGVLAANPSFAFVSVLDGPGWDAGKVRATEKKRQQNSLGGRNSQESQFGHMTSEQISDEMRRIYEFQFVGMTEEQISDERSRRGLQQWEGKSAEERKAIHAENRAVTFRKTGQTDYDIRKKQQDTKKKKKMEELGGEAIVVYSPFCPCGDDGLPLEDHRRTISEHAKKKGIGYDLLCTACVESKRTTDKQMFYALQVLSKVKAKRAAIASLGPCQVEGCNKNISRDKGKKKYCRQHAKGRN